MERDEAKWVAILLLVALIFGSSFVAMKSVLSSFGTFAFLSIRFWLAALLFGAYLLWKRRKISGEEWKCGAVLGIVLFIIFATQTWGLNFTTPSNSAFVTMLYVIFVPVLSATYLRKMPAGKIWLAVAIAAAGLYFMTGADAGVNIGDAMTLVCALFCAVQITLLAKYTRYCDPMHLVFVQIAVVAALSTLLVAPLGEVPASFPLQALAIIAYLALFGSILAQWGIAEAQRHMETSKAALILLSQLIFAALFSYLVWGETFTALKTAGALLILLALFIAEYDGIRI